jgi:hypothetical protein
VSHPPTATFPKCAPSNPCSRFVYLYFTVIETKGKNGPLPLEEIAQLFDGVDSRDNIAAAGAAGAAGIVPPTEQSQAWGEEKAIGKDEVEHVEKEAYTLRA